jgi:hypothetical protein
LLVGSVRPEAIPGEWLRTTASRRGTYQPDFSENTMIVSQCRETLLDHQRIVHTARLFGADFARTVEPLIHATADLLSVDYDGGRCNFFTLSGGSFYMAPRSDRLFRVCSVNGHKCRMSADALGVTACLFCYGHLSVGNSNMAQVYAAQFHGLRDYAMDHREAAAILAATD